MASLTLRERIRRRLADETGRIHKQAPFTVALCYPSPYSAGMSSLGYQRIYRALMDAPGLACERAFLDDECEADAALETEHPVTYESLRPIEELPVLAFSVAYELEIAGLVRMLNAAGIPARRRDRDARHPLVIAGGPLTFSNPMPLAAIVDAIVVGEADARVVDGGARGRERRGRATRSSTPSRRSRTSSSRPATRTFPRSARRTTPSSRRTRRSARRTPSSPTCSSSRPSAAARAAAATA